MTWNLFIALKWTEEKELYVSVPLPQVTQSNFRILLRFSDGPSYETCLN